MIIKNCCEQRETSKLFKQGSEMKKQRINTDFNIISHLYIIKHYLSLFMVLGLNITLSDNKIMTLLFSFYLQLTRVLLSTILF